MLQVDYEQADLGKPLGPGSVADIVDGEEVAVVDFDGGFVFRLVGSFTLFLRSRLPLELFRILLRRDPLPSDAVVLAAVHQRAKWDKDEVEQQEEQDVDKRLIVNDVLDPLCPIHIVLSGIGIGQHLVAIDRTRSRHSHIGNGHIRVIEDQACADGLVGGCLGTQDVGFLREPSLPHLDGHCCGSVAKDEDAGSEGIDIGGAVMQDKKRPVIQTGINVGGVDETIVTVADIIIGHVLGQILEVPTIAEQNSGFLLTEGVGGHLPGYGLEDFSRVRTG